MLPPPPVSDPASRTEELLPPAPPVERASRSVAPGPPWRSRDDRVVAGVAGGLAEWLGISSVIVRGALAFLLAASGIGPILYVVLAAVVPVADRSVPESERPIRLPVGAARRRPAIALVIALGATVALAVLAAWWGKGLALPAMVLATAISLVWERTTPERRDFWRARLVRLPGDPVPGTADGGRVPLPSLGRLLVGSLLLLGGTFWVLDATDPDSVIPVLTAIGVTIGGIVLVTGPWLSVMWRDLSRERSERIRSEERSEVAAQLHDSVLQTLALIQRHPETTRPVAQLARQQERSLRAWLFELDPLGSDAASDTFADCLRAAANDVEDRYGLPVELVLVGDAASDTRTHALIAAAREAMANAAAHSGADLVAVFAEVTARSITVFVRDRGIGFQVDDIPADRQGVRESIVARLDRNGGVATVTSTAGAGTEVGLELPR